MGKIIEFRYPAGYAASLPEDYTIRNQYLPEPCRKIVPFLEAKQALELGAVKREILRETAQKPIAPPVPRKRPLVISALPGEPLPPEHPDFRPLLQRDGLILLSWAKWNNHQSYRLCYRINWIKSCGKSHQYSTGFIYEVDNEKEFALVMPSQRGDRCYRQGLAGRSLYEADPRNIPDNNIADYVFLTAPDLNAATIPLFVEKLKLAGSTVDFDFDFSLGKAKELEFKRQADEIEALKVEGVQNG
jgi:hypothetical protein